MNDDLIALTSGIDEKTFCLNFLTLVQILVASFVFLFLALKKGGPFSKSAAAALLVLGAVFAVRAVLQTMIVSDVLSLLFAGSALRPYVLLETLDVSGLIAAAMFVLMSFLIRYGREFRIDSEEIA